MQKKDWFYWTAVFLTGVALLIRCWQWIIGVVCDGDHSTPFWLFVAFIAWGMLCGLRPEPHDQRP